MGRQMPFVGRGVKEKMTGKLHFFPEFSQGLLKYPEINATRPALWGRK
jgi:hypothetical protein